MSIALLDVNVLIALFDTKHSFHDFATRWFRNTGMQGWATCPIVENGLIRIASQPNYPTVENYNPGIVCGHLQQLKQVGNYHFWPDEVSLNDADLFDLRNIRTHRQVTDAYLVGLAYKHKGRLVTFDRGITAVYLTNKKAKLVEWI